ncbi:unnamed protein product [Symbiodinium necroappetens]|uniref:Uncharacterized protein n=1 Tax=Symbiodinium necroappetens TaxID=1628268 RepID=A0A813BNN7_9DINO|nr:unnamed protein product [Symbiodinium necroappetens]
MYCVQILIFLVLTFYMFPLLLFESDCQAVAESLVVGVLAYITAYYPVLERHTYLTCFVGLYAVVASMKMILSNASITNGMRHMLLQNCAYAILRRSLVYVLESRLVIPYLQHGQAALQGSGKLIGCEQMKNFSINSSFFVAAGSSLRWIAGWRTKL